jgi:ferritin-like metal-binding protein YciE
MAGQGIKTLIAQGLQALRAGGEVAKKATAEIQADASHPELKAALQDGNRASEQWAQRIEKALAETGGAEDTGNPVLEAHYEVSKRIRRKAPDAVSRDLGIVAASQLALHYWIASFGTLDNYAAKLGLAEIERSMRTSLDEAKQADQQHTAIAEKMLAQGG